LFIETPRIDYFRSGELRFKTAPDGFENLKRFGLLNLRRAGAKFKRVIAARAVVRARSAKTIKFKDRAGKRAF